VIPLEEEEEDIKLQVLPVVDQLHQEELEN
jgi:hypothetical protein